MIAFVEIPYPFPQDEPESEGHIYNDILKDAGDDQKANASWYPFLDEHLVGRD